MKYILLVVLLSLCVACGDNIVISPKPRTFPRVDYPERNYVLTSFDDCPFEAEVPVYSRVYKVEEISGMEAHNDCWFNVDFPDLNATIYLSYVPITSYAQFEDFRKDTYTIVNQINRNSTYMAEIPFSKGKGAGGIIFEFEGAAASPYQFYITDSLTENIRGSLYINSEVNLDSLAPVISFLEEDVKHFIATFQWKGN